MDTEESIRELKKQLYSLINSNLMSIDEIKKINKTGVYAIYENEKNKPAYIGKSKKRDIKVRMRELTVNFQSHTFNKKILNQIFNVSTQKLKELDKEKRKKLQHKANEYIKRNFRIRFIHIPYNGKEIERSEHFAIGVENPEFND